MQLQSIQHKIFEIRGQKVMLDFDLAALYEVETRVFNQAVKRNVDSFPEDFMFRLTTKEWNSMRSQIVTSYIQSTDNEAANESEFVISLQKKRRKDLLPYAFTEHGVTMLASVLKSPIARKMNIAIVRAFIALRKYAIQYKDILEQLDELREKIGSHDAQLNQIYEALENMLDKKVEEENQLAAWKNRKPIGFKK
ncbi:MAG: ORF6N domain-containing protein [Bacteroidota bacterium]|nr:ORF6N domain-containing protein [Bacteroidota bacterium]